MQIQPLSVEAAEGRGWGESGAPQYFAYASGAIRLYPTPDAAYAYTLRHYAKLTALDGSNTTNFILTTSPDAYLYGCLAEMAAFARDWADAQIWQQQFENALAGIERADRRERFSGPVRALIDPLLLGATRSNIVTDQ